MFDYEDTGDTGNPHDRAHESDHWVPSSMDSRGQDVALAVFLEGADITRMSGHDRVRALQARQRMASHHQAQLYRDMSAIADSFIEMGESPDAAIDLAATEIRAALKLTRQAADSEMAFALDLIGRLPRVFSLLDSGTLDVRRTKILVFETSHLEDHIAEAVIDQILDDAPRLTTGQLRARLRKLCVTIQPEEAKERFDHAHAERRVYAEPTGAGTANLMGFDLQPHLVAAATERINAIARSLRVKGEERTMDQLKADAFIDLLLGETDAKGDGAVVQLNVDLGTLAELNDHPGELGGYGPVIADIARQVADDQPDAEWRFAISDPDTGLPVGGGVTRRRPSAVMRRRVEIRDGRCVFPGCRMPSTKCDLDHRVEWANGGPTSEQNLAPVCEHDHTVRHAGPWRCTLLERGDFLWTSPLGHTYTTSGLDPPPD